MTLTISPDFPIQQVFDTILPSIFLVFCIRDFFLCFRVIWKKTNEKFWFYYFCWPFFMLCKLFSEKYYDRVMENYYHRIMRLNAYVGLFGYPLFILDFFWQIMDIWK